MVNKNIDKYLAHYAEPECQYLSLFPKKKHFKHVVVIPAYKENIHFVKRFLASPLVGYQVLFVCVINQPEHDKHKNAQQDLWQQCCDLGTVTWQNFNINLVEFDSHNSALLLVDRFNHAIDSKQGVGLARKIGADLSLRLIQQDIISSRWIHSSDADVTLPSDYFDPLTLLPQTHKAACFNFYHYCKNDAIYQASRLYELALHYYVAGLRYAKSNYAFYTIGSILAFDAEAYASVRGFPKRSAGEDFYLLNKLAKLGKVAFVEQTQLKITARTSDRVPFGTGPAVAKILQLQNMATDYHYYNPQVFDLLKSLLHSFNQLPNYRQSLKFWLAQHDFLVVKALNDIGFITFVAKQQQATDAQFMKQLTVWFDAFKTLKFIHALREQGINDIPLLKAIGKANFKVYGN
jgi:hypothetical protein